MPGKKGVILPWKDDEEKNIRGERKNLECVYEATEFAPTWRKRGNRRWVGDRGDPVVARELAGVFPDRRLPPSRKRRVRGYCE